MHSKNRTHQLSVVLLTMILLAFCAATAVAEDRHRMEFFLGFSGRTGADPILRGWNVSAAAHLNEELAIVADFSGHYDSRRVTSSLFNGTAGIVLAPGTAPI